MISVLLALLITLQLSCSTNAHGVMCNPRQRAASDSNGARMCGSALSTSTCPAKDDCPHCLNGGSVGTVLKNLPSSGWQSYDPINNFDMSAARAGLCGDPVGNDNHMLGGKFMCFDRAPITTTWTQGQVVDLSVTVHVNHNGFFKFFLCNLDKCGTSDISATCFKNGHCYELERVPNEECEASGQDMYTECGRIDRDHPGRWYVPCRSGQNVRYGSNGRMRYRLPADVTCEHCVMQWYWTTANRCNDVGFVEYFENNAFPFGRTCGGDGGSRGGFSKGFARCAGRVVPEEFWSCADVAIISSGDVSPRPTDSASVAPSPSESPLVTGSDTATITPSPSQSLSVSTPDTATMSPSPSALLLSPPTPATSSTAMPSTSSSSAPTATPLESPTSTPSISAMPSPESTSTPRRGGDRKLPRHCRNGRWRWYWRHGWRWYCPRSRREDRRRQRRRCCRRKCPWGTWWRRRRCCRRRCFY